ncbi:Octanoyltransferase [bacterium HR36]|nr:Octanoyltransferase [bacterium HR36]
MLLQRRTTEKTLCTYLLGKLEWTAALQVQRLLVAEAARSQRASVLLCEHSGCISIGRQGSYRHVVPDLEELQRRGWQVHWVNRGGGCWLHLPGQVVIYLVVPLAFHGWSLAEYLRRLRQALVDVVRDYLLSAETPAPGTEVWVQGRPIACLGVHVRQGVTSFGGILNIGPDLTYYPLVRTSYNAPPMTSLERECHRRIRSAEVREFLLQHLCRQLQYESLMLSLEHPWLMRKASESATVTSRRR